MNNESVKIGVDDVAGGVDGLIASGAVTVAPLKPPADWFDQPEPDHPEPLTVEADGRVHGHLAPWDGCHTGMVNGRGSSCVKPPKSLTGYRMFHLGQLELDNGESIPVGKIVVGQGGHADLSESLQAATAHYDKTAQVGAFVRARNGKHGPFLSGVLRHDIAPEQLRDFRANPPSGDWRMLNHNLELVAAVAVPVPGFGIPAMVASAHGEITAIVMQGFECDCDRDASYLRAKRMIRNELQ